MSEIIIKPKYKGWKEGVLKQDLIPVVGSPLKKEQIVRYRRYKVYESTSHTWFGKFEWHYMDQSNSNLIRSSDFII